MFSWLKKRGTVTHNHVTYKGGHPEPPPPEPEPAGDGEELEEFILNSETTRRDPETGLPQLPNGWVWALRQGGWGYFSYQILIEDKARPDRGWIHLLDSPDRPARQEMPSLAAEALRSWREVLQRQLDAAPLGSYPPNSVTE